jgi:hypothetical protein
MKNKPTQTRIFITPSITIAFLEYESGFIPNGESSPHLYRVRKLDTNITQDPTEVVDTVYGHFAQQLAKVLSDFLSTPPLERIWK